MPGQALASCFRPAEMTACEARSELLRLKNSKGLRGWAELDPAWVESGLERVRKFTFSPEKRAAKTQEKLPKVNMFSLDRDAIGMPLSSHVV